MSPSPIATLGDLFHRARAFGGQTALAQVRSTGMELWSFQELYGKATAVANGLAALGIGRNDPVALIGANSPAYVAILLGVIRCGATAMPLDPQLGRAAIERMVTDNGCRVAFLGSEQLSAIAIPDTCRRFVMGQADSHPDTWTAMLAPEGKDLPSLDPTDTALLVYTSGTTGTPKPVPLSHGNIVACIGGLMEKGLVAAGDRILVPLPLHHVYPLVVGILAPLAAGACVVFPASLTGPDLRQALQQSGATHLIGVPRLYHAVVQALLSTASSHPAGGLLLGALRSARWIERRTGWQAGKWLFAWLRARFAPRLRILVSGGAALDPDLHRTLAALGWAVLIGYGLTETGPILAFTRLGERRVGTVGRALDGVALRIAEPDADGVGEIEAQGPNVFSGYRGNPAATEAAFTRDGWFRTGDLGAIDAGGTLRIVARKSEVIVLPDGKKIDPELLEAVYQEHPCIRELGVFMHDGGLCAVLVPDLEKLDTHGHTQVREELQRIIAGIAALRPSYQRLDGFAISRQPLPRTPVGKIRRHLLPGLYRELREGRTDIGEPSLSPEDAALLRHPTAGKLWSWLQARYPGRPVTLDANPQLDLGIDSLDWIGLTLEIERACGVVLSEAAIAQVASVRDLLKVATESAGRPAVADDAAIWRQARRALSPSVAQRVLRALLLALDGALMRLVFSLRVAGAENIPAHGPFLICPNHASYLDPLALAAALPPRVKRNLCWAGWTGILFNTGPRRSFSAVMGVLPIDPTQPARSLAIVGSALKAGRTIVWFPEGARSTDGTLQRFPAGTGCLIREVSVPMVPVFIAGAYEAWPIRRRWPRRGRLSVTFGPPVTLAALGGPALSEQDIADRLHGQIATLSSRPGATRPV